MEEVDEVHDLENDLCDLKVIKDHIVFLHLLKSSVLEVKNKVIGVPLYFLF